MSNDKFLHAHKRLGQNFLHDQRVIENIVASLNPNKDDLIVEIGPGRGALTHALLQSKCTLHLIEFDRDLAAYWRDQAEHNATLTVHETDVLKFDFSSLAANRAIRIIGNLPYNISSPVLFRLLEQRQLISDMILMFQKEVVDRMVAEPDSKQYGRLSVMVQQASSCVRIMNVAAGAFSPPPKVKSSVVRIVPYTEPVFAITDEALFKQVVKRAFSTRRKMLRNSLRDWLETKDYMNLNFNPGRRPEQLDVAEFVTLTNYIATKSAK